MSANDAKSGLFTKAVNGASDLAQAPTMTYRITKYPSSGMDNSQVDMEIERAFQVWSDTTGLRFRPRHTGRVDFEIRFERRQHGGWHYDEWVGLGPNGHKSFDGSGSVLAHAAFPEDGGDFHFDDDETWTAESNAGTNLFQVAAHEIGHTLGLSHSNEPNAMMYASYGGYTPNMRLHSDDISAIQSLYGVTKVENDNDRIP